MHFSWFANFHIFHASHYAPSVAEGAYGFTFDHMYVRPLPFSSYYHQTQIKYEFG